MSDIDFLVKKYREKLEKNNLMEPYRQKIAEPVTNEVFKEQFAVIFENIIDEINLKTGSKVISYCYEGKKRFSVLGQHHKITFQKDSLFIEGDEISQIIIPIYIWKGMAKHLDKITFDINAKSKSIRWHLKYNCVKDYAVKMFENLIEDKDFSM